MEYMGEKIITREKAFEVLSDLLDSGILDGEIEKSLQEIMFCIEQEQLGYHCWGGDDDIYNLHVAYRVDLITDELKAELQAIHDKYSFTPAPYEAEQFKEIESEDED